MYATLEHRVQFQILHLSCAHERNIILFPESRLLIDIFWYCQKQSKVKFDICSCCKIFGWTRRLLCVYALYLFTHFFKMGSSKKHKKNKSEKRERYEEYSSDHRPSSLKLILKVGNTPEYGNDSPYNIQSDSAPGGLVPSGSGDLFSDDYPEKHKKSKKKKKKKDREKRHKHHHKEKRHHHRSRSPVHEAKNDIYIDNTTEQDIAIPDDSSQEDEIDFNDDSCTQSLQENMQRFAGISADNSPANRPMTKPLIQRKLIDEQFHSPSMSPIKECNIQMASPETASTPGTVSTGSMTPSAHQQFNSKNILDVAPKTPSSCSESGRETRTCVLKQLQTKTPLTKLLDYLLRSIEKRDPHQFFAWPVTDDIAPGYSSIITKAMDFSTIRQKIEDNEYSTLTEFSDDFKLMCDNAIRYNHVETVYHKAARKLLHVGEKLINPDNLIRSLKPLSGYMRELTSKELGFEFRYGEANNSYHVIDSADESASTGADEPPTQAQLEEEEKRRNIRIENEPKSKYEPYVDDLTSEEILAQVQNATRMVKKKLTTRQKAHQMGFLRQRKDGTTSMKILLNNNNTEGPEKVVQLGELIGKLKQGTGQIQGFREDRRNSAKIVKPLNYGAFSSFAPIFDSRFSNLNKEETELVLSTYGDSTAAEYAESIMEFTTESSYASILANGLLDYLTQGEHSKTIKNLYENQCQRYESSEIEKVLPDSKSKNDDDYEKYKNMKIDYDKLKSLNEIGIDVSFLDPIESEIKTLEVQKKIQDQLNTNSSLIEKLHSTQNVRLSQPLPHHLANVPQAGNEEHQLAAQITQNITDMAKKLSPSAIAEPHALRKAMGVSNVGLQPLPQPHLIIPSILKDRITPPDLALISTNSISDTNQVPMDIDEDISRVVHSANVPVDLVSELRDFLENGSSLGGTNPTDDNTIEQMLLN